MKTIKAACNPADMFVIAFCMFLCILCMVFGFMFGSPVTLPRVIMFWGCIAGFVVTFFGGIAAAVARK
jgi:hypothetical protein